LAIEGIAVTVGVGIFGREIARVVLVKVPAPETRCERWDQAQVFCVHFSGLARQANVQHANRVALRV
jgi:hypothetical protein